jgi:hypothetical protein
MPRPKEDHLRRVQELIPEVGELVRTRTGDVAAAWQRDVDEHQLPALRRRLLG